MSDAVGETTNFLSWRSHNLAAGLALADFGLYSASLSTIFFRSQASKAVESRSGINSHIVRWGAVTFVQAKTATKAEGKHPTANLNGRPIQNTYCGAENTSVPFLTLDFTPVHGRRKTDG